MFRPKFLLPLSIALALPAAAMAQTSAPAEGQNATEPPPLAGPASPGTPPPQTIDAEATQTDPALRPESAPFMVYRGDETIRLGDLIGLEVTAAGGEVVGTVEDVLINPDGQVLGVTLDIGGFLGIGSREIAIPREMLTIHAVSNEEASVSVGHISTSIDAGAFEDAPAYER